jgi:hypothetical protein
MEVVWRWYGDILPFSVVIDYVVYTVVYLILHVIRVFIFHLNTLVHLYKTMTSDMSRSFIQDERPVCYQKDCKHCNPNVNFWGCCNQEDRKADYVACPHCPYCKNIWCCIGVRAYTHECVVCKHPGCSHYLI